MLLDPTLEHSASEVMTEKQMRSIPHSSGEGFRFRVGVLLPEEYLHDSGFKAFTVACFGKTEVIRCGGSDVLYRLPEGTSVDVLPNGLVRFFTFTGSEFEVTSPYSSFEVRRCS